MTKEFDLNRSISKTIGQLGQRLAGIAESQGLLTGYPDLDGFVKVLRPGELFVVASRGAMGKTTLMLNIVEHICIDQKVPCMVVSCSLAADEIVRRIILSRAGVAQDDSDEGNAPNEDDLGRARVAVTELQNSRLVVEDKIFSVEDLCARARRFQDEHNTGFLAIERLQLLRSGSLPAGAGRKREVAAILTDLKTLARELGIPILLLSELNRGPEHRRGKYAGIPRLEDLRSHDAIHKYADHVGLLYREAYYFDGPAEECKGAPAHLIVISLRRIVHSNIPLTFHDGIRRFVPAGRC